MDHLKNASLRFASLLKKETEKRKEPSAAFSFLRDHEEAIKEARLLKVSHVKITELLNEAGVAASIEVVRAFCKQVLHEPKRVKRKRKAKAIKTKLASKTEKVKTTQAKPPENLNSKKQSKEGFRVARDEDL